MAKRRDYKAEYARRNQLAQKAGWKTYAQERKAKADYKKANHDVHKKFEAYSKGPGKNASAADKRRAFWAFWQGLIDPRTRNDISRNSAKATWFVDYYPDWDGDRDIWEELYPGE